VTKKAEELAGKVEVTRSGSRATSSFDSYPHRSPQAGEVVEYCWEDDEGTLRFQGAQVMHVADRHIVGLLVSNEHQNPVEVEYSLFPRPNTWRFS